MCEWKMSVNYLQNISFLENKGEIVATLYLEIIKCHVTNSFLSIAFYI